MTIDDIVEHNRRHTLTVLNDYVMRLAIALGIVAILASVFPGVTVPYLGIKVPPFLITAIIQSALLALLINTNNVYHFFFVMIDLDISTRWLGSLVYIAHFALAFFAIAHPTHWLVGVAVLFALIVLVNLQVYRLLKNSPGHPFLPVIHTWFKRGARHLASVIVLAAAVEAFSNIELYERLHNIKFDITGVAVAKLIIGDFQTLLFAYAAFRVWQNTLRRVHITAVPNFDRDEIAKLREGIDAYLKNKAS